MDKRLESRCNNHVKEWLVMVKSDEFLLIITRNGFLSGWYWLIVVDMTSKTRELHPDGTTGTTGTTTMPCQGFEGLDYPEICRWDFPRKLQRSSVKCTKKKTYAVGIFPFQSNLGSWRSPIDSMGISVLLRREDWTPWNTWDKFGAPKKPVVFVST